MKRNMTVAQARLQLNKRYPKIHQCVYYECTTFSNGDTNPTCSLYLDSGIRVNAKTFEEAFELLPDAIKKGGTINA